MRKTFKHLFAALAATAALAGCTREITPPYSENDKIAPATEGSRVIAVAFAPQTRTTLEGLQPMFAPNDSILISNGDALDTCEVNVGSNPATISTDLPGPLTAVYPYKAAKVDGNQIDGVLVSTEQSGTFADANICMAENITTSASFTNQTAIFKITTNAEAKCVEVSATGAAIANGISGEYTDLHKIHVEADAGNTVFVSILPTDHIVEDLSLSDSTTTKTFVGNKTQVAVNTFYTTAITADNFYITGGPFEWDLSCTNERRFSHSEKPIVEDPWFTITFPAVSSGETYFAIFDDTVCEKYDWYCVFGSLNGNGNSGESGFAARRKYLGDDGVFCVPYGCDSIKIDFNALTFEYKVTEIFSDTPSFPDYIYEIGAESSWGTSHPLAGLAGNGVYQGYYYLDGEYKFKPYADDWYGDWEYAGTIEDGYYSMADNGGSNFPLPDSGAGVYQINVDLNAMTATLAKVQSISLIGGFNSWNGDVDMTYNTAGGYWECEPFVLENDDQVKVRMNHDWGTNWGGLTGTSFDNLQQNGENFTVPAGTYHVKFYLSCEGQNRIVFEPVL